MLVAGFIVRNQQDSAVGAGDLDNAELHVGVLTFDGFLGSARRGGGSRGRWASRGGVRMPVGTEGEVASAVASLFTMQQTSLSIAVREEILPIDFYEIPDLPPRRDGNGEEWTDDARAVYISDQLTALVRSRGNSAASTTTHTRDSLAAAWVSQRDAQRDLETLRASARQTSNADRDLGALTVDGPFVRPNNEEYKPRVIGGRHQDVALLRHLHAQKMPVRLYGPAGSGKTAVVEAAFPDVITVLGNGDLTVSGLVGGLVPDGASWRWVDGPLTRAMREGKVLFVDEILRIPNEVLAILLGAMDGRGILRLDDNPEAAMVEAAPGFGVIAAYNPDITGGRQLDEAILSRFVVGIEITTDFEVAAELGVPSNALTVARNLATRNAADVQEGGYGNWVPQMRDLLAFRDVLPLGEEFAVGALLGACPNPQDVEVVAETIRTVFGFEPTRLTAGGRA